MIIVTGKTFEHRDLLKAWRGSWNNAARHWEFDDLNETQKSTLSAKVGIMVHEQEPPAPIDWSDDDNINIIRRLLNYEAPAPVIRDGSTAIYGDDERYLNHFKDQNPTAFFGFSSLAKFTDYIAALDRPPIGRDDGWNTDRARWAGTRNMPAAIDLARNGWHDGIERAASLEIPHATARKRRHGIAGGLVNVGRLLAGNPAHMVRRPKLPGRRVVTLFVETFMSSGIHPDNAITRAILIAHIADVMEREGYSCEIVAIVTTLGGYGSSVGHQCAITLKQAGERLSLLDIAFALGHPSFFRRLVFAAVGASDACGSTWDTQGHPSAAFDHHHRVRSNEFYIRQLSLASQRNLDDDDPLDMLRFIEPDNLPIKIRND